MIELSIIIVNFNTRKLTIDCINCILKNNTGKQYEIIVVDNNSKDDSIQILNKLQAEIPNMKLIINSKNLGFAKANNQGIKISKGENILLLNSDAQIIEGTVEKLLDFAEVTPNAGVVAPRLLNPDGTVQGSVFRFPTLRRAIEEYWLGKGNILDKYYPEGKEPVEVDSVTMAAFLITPKARKSVGMLNEKYFMYFEDLDYCRNINKAGLKVYYLPEATVIHYHGSSGKDIADKKNQWRRLIPSSKIYHGWFKHNMINFIIWSGQKWQKFFKS